jgi:hypothetical protein
MADGFDSTTPQSERVAFCQDCGKPLTTETVRNVGSGVFCEPCLVQRVGATPPPPPSGGTYAGGFGTGVPPVGGVPPGQPTNLPNPAAAGWLAVIPGAGAVYNGQYAKGLVIFVIFMVLSSLGDSHSIFGLAAVVFWIFQIIDAHHTAKARILGTPLPNPFGLNDVGDRMGFGKNWPGSMAGTASTVPPVNPTPTPTQDSVHVPPVPPSNWAGYVHPSSFSQSAQAAGTTWNAAPVDSAIYTPVNPWTATPPSVAPTTPAAMPSRRFPVAAIVLIVLGLFALTNSVMHLEISASWICALVLGLFGVWSLAHRLQTAHRDHPEGADAATLISCALRGPAPMMIVLAILFTLQAARVMTLGQTWPVIVIALGLQLLIQRAIDRSTNIPGVNAPYAGGAAWPGAAQETPAPQTTASTNGAENGGTR